MSPAATGSAGSAPLGSAAALIPASGSAVAPSGALPVVRRMPLLRREAADTGASRNSAAHTTIRPTTVDLLRSARVTPPQGIFAPASRTANTVMPGTPAAPIAAPPPAPSAAGYPEDSVVRRFFESSRPQIGGHRAPRGSDGGSGLQIGGHRSARGSDGGGSGGGSGLQIGGHRSNPQPVGTPAVAPQGTGTSGLGSTPHIQDSLTSREWAQLVDEVTRRLEARVTEELARRGRRYMPRPM